MPRAIQAFFATPATNAFASATGGPADWPPRRSESNRGPAARPPGRADAITDLGGVAVGHVTVARDDRRRPPAGASRGPAHGCRAAGSESLLDALAVRRPPRVRTRVRATERRVGQPA